MKREQQAKQAVTAEGELREAIREGHALLKDLRQATKAAQAEIPKLLDEQLTEAVKAEIREALEQIRDETRRYTVLAEARIMSRFNRIAEILIGPQPRGTGLEGLADEAERARAQEGGGVMRGH